MKKDVISWVEKLCQFCPASHRTRELTFIAIITANYFSTSNPTLSLPHSSSILANPMNQSDKYSIAESEGFHNSKGDIAD